MDTIWLLQQESANLVTIAAEDVLDLLKMNVQIAKYQQYSKPQPTPVTATQTSSWTAQAHV
jgi:hypothetical protein